MTECWQLQGESSSLCWLTKGKQLCQCITFLTKLYCQMTSYRSTKQHRQHTRPPYLCKRDLVPYVHHTDVCTVPYYIM